MEEKQKRSFLEKLIILVLLAIFISFIIIRVSNVNSIDTIYSINSYYLETMNKESKSFIIEQDKKYYYINKVENNGGILPIRIPKDSTTIETISGSTNRPSIEIKYYNSFNDKKEYILYVPEGYDIKNAE